jgi:glycosyltransferase involved in cell wall biosynthesis
MRAGLPVVATRVAGVPELVEHGVTGFLCAAGDSVAVAAKLEKLLVSAALRAQMGAKARGRYESRFRFEYMLGKTLNAYAEVLATRPSRTRAALNASRGIE